MSATQTKTDILLDAGTNELEVLVFRLAGGLFGVNVAKVREVIRYTEPTVTPGQHGSVIGMVNLRGAVIALIDLKKHLGLGVVDPADPSNRVIVTEFNGVRSGYVVDGVEQIYRMPWTSVRPAPDVHSIDTSRRDLPSVSSCTGVVEMNDRLVLMLDFESVADAILLDDKLHLDAVDNPDNIDRRSFRVVLAEDSPFMRDLLHRVLTNSGYTRAEVYANGAEAWQAISTTHHADPIHAVVSDIEMPQMDGLHLCKRIRAHGGDIAGLPVVLFSSLISEDNRKKGAQVGATIQISKPNLAEVVTLVDRAVTGRLSAEQPAA